MNWILIATGICIINKQFPINFESLWSQLGSDFYSAHALTTRVDQVETTKSEPEFKSERTVTISFPATLRALSMVDPGQWPHRHLASLRLNYDRQWLVVETGSGIDSRDLFGGLNE